MQEKKQKTDKSFSINAFWNKHKKEIIIASSIIGAIGVTFLAVLGVKYKSLEKWLKKASLEDLNEARNNTHHDWMQHTINDEYRSNLWSLMQLLDKKISEREWAGKIPTGPSYHREHGYNLYKPD